MFFAIGQYQKKVFRCRNKLHTKNQSFHKPINWKQLLSWQIPGLELYQFDWFLLHSPKMRKKRKKRVWKDDLFLHTLLCNRLEESTYFLNGDSWESVCGAIPNTVAKFKTYIKNCILMYFKLLPCNTSKTNLFAILTTFSSVHPSKSSTIRSELFLNALKYTLSIFTWK